MASKVLKPLIIKEFYIFLQIGKSFLDQLGIVDNQHAVNLLMEEFIQGRNSEEISSEDLKILDNITNKMKEQFGLNITNSFTKIATSKCPEMIIHVCKCKGSLVSL